MKKISTVNEVERKKKENWREKKNECFNRKLD